MKGTNDAKEKHLREARRIRICYGDAVTVLPMSAADAAERASGIDCKILMLLSYDVSAQEGTAEALQAFADRIGCTFDEVERAIAYWKGAGVLLCASDTSESRAKVGRPKKQSAEEIVAEELKKRSAAGEIPPNEGKETSPEKKVRRADELPNYTIAELSVLLEKRKNLSLFLDECQRAYGKMFNPRDVSRVLGMLDYLSLSEEYVLTLLRYFGEMPEEERKSLHYIEKMAFTLTDEGITDASALREHLENLKLLKTKEGQIRSIFGMGTRAFTAKEKKAVLLWLGEYGSSMELIRLAYEKTIVGTGGKPSLLYASKILERWYREGLTTPLEVEASEKKSETESLEGNFDTDDFFEAALRRSYGEAYEQIYKGKGTDEQEGG